jgi:hypothetical protein
MQPGSMVKQTVGRLCTRMRCAVTIEASLHHDEHPERHCFRYVSKSCSSRTRRLQDVALQRVGTKRGGKSRSMMSLISDDGCSNVTHMLRPRDQTARVSRFVVERQGAGSCVSRYRAVGVVLVPVDPEIALLARNIQRLMMIATTTPRVGIGAQSEDCAYTRVP